MEFTVFSFDRTNIHGSSSKATLTPPRGTWFSFLLALAENLNSVFQSKNVIKAWLSVQYTKGWWTLWMLLTQENCLFYSFIGIQCQNDFLFLREVETFLPYWWASLIVWFDGPLVLRLGYGYRVNVRIIPWPEEHLCNIINSLFLDCSKHTHTPRSSSGLGLHGIPDVLIARLYLCFIIIYQHSQWSKCCSQRGQDVFNAPLSCPLSISASNQIQNILTDCIFSVLFCLLIRNWIQMYVIPFSVLLQNVSKIQLSLSFPAAQCKGWLCGRLVSRDESCAYSLSHAQWKAAAILF